MRTEKKHNANYSKNLKVSAKHIFNRKKTLQNRKEISTAARKIKNVYLQLPFSTLSVSKYSHSKTARSQI